MTGAELIRSMYDDLYEALPILEKLGVEVVGEELCGQIASDISRYEKNCSELEKLTEDLEVKE